MPVSFTLHRIGDKDETPVKFAEIDDEICKHFGVEPHPNNYYKMWFDIEGYGVASGRTFAELREMMPERSPIIDFFELRYRGNAWR